MILTVNNPTTCSNLIENCNDVNDKLTDKAQIKFLLCSIAHHCDLKDHFRADVQEEELSRLLGLRRGSPFLNPWKHWRQPVIDNQGPACRHCGLKPESSGNDQFNLDK